MVTYSLHFVLFPELDTRIQISGSRVCAVFFFLFPGDQCNKGLFLSPPVGAGMVGGVFSATQSLRGPGLCWRLDYSLPATRSNSGHPWVLTSLKEREQEVECYCSENTHIVSAQGPFGLSQYNVTLYTLCVAGVI